MKAQNSFEKCDISLLSHALSLMPTLELATYAAKLSERCLNYPLDSYDDLRPLFNQELHSKFSNTGITFKLMKKFLSKNFFPIVDSSDFLGKVYAALIHGERFHASERGHNKKSLAAFNELNSNVNKELFSEKSKC